MKHIYRKLRQGETVRATDEVLNQFGEVSWTTCHSYAGEKVKDCVGSLTGIKRTFRRRVL